MGALRKAGVWLGLVEEEDERYDGGYDDEFVDEDEDFTPVRPRTASRSTLSRASAAAERERERERERQERQERMERAAERDREEALRAEERQERAERASVRPLARPIAAPTQAGTGYPTQDNLALAPQVQLRERAVVPEEPERRYQITTLHPTTYREARTIGEHFRDGVPVIINLTEMEEADARRLVDFAAGLAFGLRGSMERVTNRVFLLSPANVQVTPEDKAKIAESGFLYQD